MCFFGTTSTGLTAQQLTQFDIGGSDVLISNTGHLTYDTPPDVTNSTFTNASGDKLWSNIQNWSNEYLMCHPQKLLFKTHL